MRIRTFAFSTQGLAILGLVACVTLLFLPALTGWQGLFHDDLGMEEFPRYLFVARSLQQKVLPLWDPHTWCGAIPFYGRYYADTYYLPLWPFYLITDSANVDLSYWTLILIPLWFHYALAAVGIFLLLRKLLSASLLAAITGSLAYALSPAFAYGYVWQQVISVQAWLPWLLFCYVQVSEKTSPKRFAALCCIVVFLITGAAPSLWPQVAFIWLAAGLVLSVMPSGNKERTALLLKPLSIMLAAGVVASALSGPYLFSFIDGLRHTSEHISLTPQAALRDPYGSLPPLYLITLFFPDIFGNITGRLFPALSSMGTVFYWEANLSAGLALTLLVAFGMAGTLKKQDHLRAGQNTRRWLVFAMLLYFFALLCALGKYTPFYELTVGRIPGAGALPRPLRYRMMQCFSAAILVAGGVEYLKCALMRQRRLVARLWIPAYIVFTFAVLLGGICLSGKAGGSFIYPWLDTRGSRTVIRQEASGPHDQGDAAAYSATAGFAAHKQSLREKITAPNPVAAHVRRNIFYWLVFSCLFLAGVSILAPARFVVLLTVLAVGELSVFGFYAMYQGTYSFDRPSQNHARLIRPSQSEFVRTALRAAGQQQGEQGMRIAFSQIFRDNFMRLTAGYSFMGYEMHPLEKRFKIALETAYGAAVDYPLYYRELLPLPVYLPLLHHFSVRKFLSGGQERIFSGAEDVVPFSGDGTLFMHTNARALPRIYTVSRAIPASADEQLRQLLSGDLRQAAYVDRPEGNPEQYRSNPQGYDFNELQARNPIRSINLSNPNRILIDIEVSVPSMLVITDVWYPGWKATVNQKPSVVQRVNYCQRGIWLKQGRHSVDMYFSPYAWRLGVTVSGVGIFVLCFCALALRQRKRLNEPS